MSKVFKINNILFYLTLVLLVFIPLYPKFPLFNVRGTFAAIRAEDILIALTLLIWFWGNFKNLRKILSDKITISIILFWLIGLLSLFSALYISQSVTPTVGFLNWLRRVEAMLLLFVGWTAVKNGKQLKIILLTMLLVTVLVCVYGIGQKYLGFPVISTSNSEFAKGQILKLTPGARPNSTFAGSYDLAVFLSMVLIFFGSMFFYTRKIFQKTLILGSGLLSALMLGFTAARTSFAAAFVGLFLVFWYLGKRMIILGLVLVTILAVVLIPSLRSRLVDTVKVSVLHDIGPTYMVPLPSPTLSHYQLSNISKNPAKESKSTTSSAVPVGIAPGEPINTTELDVSRSINIRTEVEWPRAIRALEKNPFLGTGYSSLTLATDNDYLRSLGEVGVLGTIALILVMVAILKRVWKNLHSSSRLFKYFSLGLLLMVLTFLINALFIDVYEASKVAYIFWMALGVGLSIENWNDI